MLKQVSRRTVIGGVSICCAVPAKVLGRGLRGGAPGLHTTGFYNFTGSNLSSYQTSVASGANTIVLANGDSTTMGGWANGTGVGSNNKAYSYPTQIAQALANGSWSSVIFENNIGGSPIASFDNRLGGSGWSASPDANLSGFLYRESNTNTTALTFTPTNSVDTFDVYYIQVSGGGVFTLDIGGSVLATVNTNGANAIVKATITVALGAHTLNIKRSSGGAVFLSSLVAYNSAQKEITILNAGGSGQKVSDFTDTSLPWSPGSRISQIAPNLSLMMFGINDWNAGTSLSAFQASLQTQITNAQTSGNVILMSGVPSDPTAGNASYATQAGYVAVISALALSNNTPFIDVWNLFGGDWSVANGRGWMANAQHPNATGYGQIAGFVSTALAAGFVSL